MMMIEVSVLVAAYNQDQYIGRCLRSLLNQTLSSHLYEIIVINDGSKDKTAYALDLFKKPKDDHIRIINNDKNLGLPACLNLGIKAAFGKYIVRVDSDDYVNRNFLSTLSFFLDMYKNSDAVACDYILVDKNEETINIVDAEEYPIACGIMFRKERLEAVGMYDEKFKCHEDQDLRIRFTKDYKIANLNLPLYRYRKHNNNMTNDKELLDNYEKLLNDKHKK